MKKLTRKEEEIMNLFWDKGAMFVKELLELYDEPKPHFNTLSTMVRTLEANGYVDHKAYGNSYQYYPVISREDYAGSSFKGLISSYFNNSYLCAVSALVKEEKISVEELKELIEQIESGDRTTD
ncbi:MAG: BlaI/MecI/CopY family transcriptional regulator [Bacteroidales bacterium]|nr:BlaI/MecI/CopY family transcriptional regulator [Bacteroidales bacterium]MBE6234194.1 BlaI/MecI/CopY family transcriptional regulator [Bacteroidales bacterium]